jgi:hypothetical protein
MNSVVASDRARDFASECHIDIDADLPVGEPAFPILMPIDDRGRRLLHVSEAADVDFYISKIDYFQSDYHVAGSRLISLILPGYRNRSTYLQSETGKTVRIHNGDGYLILGSGHAENEDFATDIYPLSPFVTPLVTIPSDSFFTFEAASWSHEPFVISEEMSADEEVALQPEQATLVTADGSRIEVPEEFRAGNFR